jgi:hypothetical protein
MPTANSYVPSEQPYIGPTVKTPTDVQPGVATGTINNRPTPVNTVSNTAPITPGVATSTEPPPPLPNAENFNLEINLASLSVTPNQVITASAVPAGTTNWIQYNNSGSFGANANLQWAQNGLWVGGVSTSGDASGIITAKNDFRAGSWKPNRFSADSDTFSRFRHAPNSPNANTTFYGFNSDPQVSKQQSTVITNETQLTSAMVLFEGVAYNTSASNRPTGTIFGVSVNNGYANDRPSTGTEFGWKKMMTVSNWGELGVAGNISINPSWQYIATQPANNQVGIVFADGTFQYTAATGGAITIKEEGTNIVASANTINFVGSGVTASNVSGVATITVPGGITGVAVQEEGTNVLATANTINFVGSGVTASNVSGVATITISSGGISGIAVQEEGTNVLATANTINFVGSGVTASNVGNVATITITSGGISGIDILANASPVTANATSISFNGPLANVANVGFGNATDVTIGLTVQDESNVISGNASIGTLNFLGSGVTVTSGPTGVANITINSGGSSGGLPGYLRTYTGGTNTPATSANVWYPLPLDNAALINTINASDYANGIVNLQPGTYIFETTAYIKNDGSDGITYVYTAIVENNPGVGVGNVIANGCRLYMGDWQTATFVATGTFTIANQTKVSVAFLQSDPSPQAVAYAENGWCTTILKLWQTA